jgi:hypothetical protein
LGSVFFNNNERGICNLGLNGTNIEHYFLPKTKSMRMLGLEDASSARALAALIATSSSCIFKVSEYKGHLALGGLIGAGWLGLLGGRFEK